jgi:hypothetical protein
MINLAAAGVAVPYAYAATGPVARPQTPGTGPVREIALQSSTGRAQRGFTPLTRSQLRELATLGNHRDVIVVDEAPAVLSVHADSAGFKPDTYTTCAGNHLCIGVYGTGLHVSKWNTSEDVRYTGTNQVTFISPAGSYYAKSYWNNVEPHASAPSYLLGNYPNNSYLCNLWSNLSGSVCARVHT